VAWKWWPSAAQSGDSLDKRWASLVKDTETPCYFHLVAKTPLRGRCVHIRQGPIPPRSHDWVNAHVAVYTMAARPHSKPTLRDLTDAGQAAAIHFLEKDTDAGLKGVALADLRDALDDSNPKVGESDPFRFDRILIANVAKGLDWEPGDRMMWARVLIQPINFRFADYSVADTDNETQKVSSVESTDSRKVSAGFSATIPGVEGPKISLEPSRERDVKMNSEVSAQYEKLGIDITRDFLRIIRESGKESDLVGNTKVPLTAVTDPDMIYRQYPGDKDASRPPGAPIVLLVTHFDQDAADKQSEGDPPKAPKQAIDVLPQEPVPPCALRARVWMLYAERKVQGGREFYDESKQSVWLKHDGEDKQDVEIMNADEVSPAIWSLKLCEDAQCKGPDTYPLMAMLKTPNGTQNRTLWRKVVFTDYGVAIRVAHWLRMHQINTPPNTDYRFNFPYDSDSIYDAGRRYVTLAPYNATGEMCHPHRDEEVSRR
jgi:hypothetical protein